MQQTYEDRNRKLRAMGYKNYMTYLNSELWETIRSRAFAFHGKNCRLCNKEAQIVHHLGYSKDVLEGKTLHQLVPLCFRCHHVLEFKKDGEKRTLAEVQSWYLYLWKKVKFANKHLPPELRKGKYTYCIYCGNKATKHQNTCRICRK